MLEMNLMLLSDVITSGLTVGAAYSMTIVSDPYLPVNPPFTLYFAQISSTYLNYVKLSLTTPATIAESVWDYVARYTHGVQLN